MFKIDEKTMKNFSNIIGFIGLIGTIYGFYRNYISSINPITRFKKYLKNPKNWKEVKNAENYLSVYCYEKDFNSRIIINWNKKLGENFNEEWINYNLFPDKTHNAPYNVILEANGKSFDREVFLSLDGGRNFVPVPKISGEKNYERKFYYDKQQIQLANIIGKYDHEENIYEFAKKCKNTTIINK